MVDITSKAAAAIVSTFTLKPHERYLQSFEEIAATAAMGAVNSFESNSRIRLSRKDFDGIFLSSATASNVIGREGQHSWETIFASNFGINIDIHAFSKGSEALHHCITELKAGEVDFVILAGCDKRSDEQHVGDISNKSIDPNLRLWNWSWQNVYATIASKYLYESMTSHEDLMAIAINDKYNASNKKGKSLKDFLSLKSKKLRRLSYDPLTNNDYALTTYDGAAALILCSPEKAFEYVQNPVFITSSASMTSPSEFWTQDNPLSYPGLEKAVRKAYQSAKISPKNIDVVSVDTKVTIVGPIALEGLGLIKYPAIKKISEHINSLEPNYSESHIKYKNDFGKEFIINPNGSTYEIGNIPGVSGLYRLINLSKQLNGTAKNQVKPEPSIGLLQEQSASGMKQMVHILEVER
ncbi:MAG: thiolase family protein [Candidatus Lokiarchaeota archaeon]|nr:thiolase family protein [Candidatus Lokiarchaeota archaeon]